MPRVAWPSPRPVILGCPSASLYGSAVPDLDLTVEMSELLIRRLTVTSVRKLLEFATVPLCAFVWLMSDELTEPLAVVSPRSTPIDAERRLLLFPAESVTLLKLTVITWALITPVRLTMY